MRSGRAPGGPLPRWLCRWIVAGLAMAPALAAVAPVRAQITGRVVGKVVDAETGEPLVGGLVMVEATNLGNVARDDGSYFINAVPVGVQRITSEYLGYENALREPRILAGETVTVDFALNRTAIEADAIIAIIDQPKLDLPDSLASPRVAVFPQPRDLPRFAPVDCSARVVAHGAFIEIGRWRLYRSVKDLACRERVPLESPETASEEPQDGVVKVFSEGPHADSAGAR